MPDDEDGSFRRRQGKGLRRAFASDFGMQAVAS